MRCKQCRDVVQLGDDGSTLTSSFVTLGFSSSSSSSPSSPDPPSLPESPSLPEVATETQNLGERLTSYCAPATPMTDPEQLQRKLQVRACVCAIIFGEHHLLHVSIQFCILGSGAEFDMIPLSNIVAAFLCMI